MARTATAEQGPRECRRHINGRRGIPGRLRQTCRSCSSFSDVLRHTCVHVCTWSGWVDSGKAGAGGALWWGRDLQPQDWDAHSGPVLLPSARSPAEGAVKGAGVCGGQGGAWPARSGVTLLSTRPPLGHSVGPCSRQGQKVWSPGPHRASCGRALHLAPRTPPSVLWAARSQLTSTVNLECATCWLGEAFPAVAGGPPCPGLTAVNTCACRQTAVCALKMCRPRMGALDGAWGEASR